MTRSRKGDSGRRNTPAEEAPAQNFQKLEKKLDAQIEARFTQIQHSSSFQGPIPPPALLAEYDKVVPGAGERILVMAETQANHRQGLEVRHLSSNIDSEKRGQWLAFILVLSCVLGGCLLVWNGKPVSGLVAMLGSLATLAGVFVYGREAQRRERTEKWGKLLEEPQKKES